MRWGGRFDKEARVARGHVAREVCRTVVVARECSAAGVQLQPQEPQEAVGQEKWGHFYITGPETTGVYGRGGGIIHTTSSKTVVLSTTHTVT